MFATRRNGQLHDQREWLREAVQEWRGARVPVRQAPDKLVAHWSNCFHPSFPPTLLTWPTRSVQPSVAGGLSFMSM